jgi:hypothetical protein
LLAGLETAAGVAGADAGADGAALFAPSVGASDAAAANRPPWSGQMRVGSVPVRKGSAI